MNKKIVCDQCGTEIPREEVLAAIESKTFGETLKTAVERYVYEGDEVSVGEYYRIREKPKTTLRKVWLCKNCR